MVIRNGKSISVWHDRWRGQVSLAEKFPQFYVINQEQEALVKNMKHASPLEDGFMRTYRINSEGFRISCIGIIPLLRKTGQVGIERSQVICEFYL